MLQVAGLFAGIGGIEKGLAASGHRAALLCENWAPAAAVLKARFGVEPASDVRELSDLPSGVDLVTAGFPCQDLSQAGRTAGITGARSGLVSEVFRLIDRSRTPLVLLENVSFMLQLDKGTAMETILAAFEERGYRWAYRVVNSLSFLPQRRERVFLLASRCDIDPADVLLADEAEQPKTQTNLETHAHGFYWTEGTRGLGWAPDAVPTLKNGSTVGIASPPAILMPDGRVIKPSIRDAERLQGFPADWTEAAEAVARPSLRWSLVGNAVTVPVAEWIGMRLAEPGASEPRHRSPLPLGFRWPRAAAFDGHSRSAVAVSAFPVWHPRPALHRFLIDSGQELSVRASRGFLHRARNGRLNFRPGFLEAVQAHLDKMEYESVSVAAE